jgi:hypothetical protein
LDFLSKKTRNPMTKNQTLLLNQKRYCLKNLEPKPLFILFFLVNVGILLLLIVMIYD